MSEKGILLESGTNEMELLAVLINGQSFGINVVKVQSIQQYDPNLITALPNKVPGVLGMLLYRDRTIPVMDLAQILDIEVTHKSEKEIIVVTEFNNAVNGFKVQGVKRIFRLSWKDLVPFDQAIWNTDYFTGSVDIEEDQILVIDLEHILSNIFPDLIIEDINEQNLLKIEDIARDQLQIIFADDSPTIRKGVSNALKSAGFSNITEFVDGAQALKYLKIKFSNGEQNLDKVVLISDIEMPRMDGLSLCRNVKQDKNLRELFVVMFSSLINKQMIAKCEGVQADTYVTKPETNQLIKLLDERCR
ncbi:chemotaxis protein [Desulfobacter latus]|uniref:Chemotaxis protein CheV n=1 Tax=Desulfobacter latus TaxID=2292 RepID=A0A850TAM5_9BACT|nr:chemotaxis protein [Desulfobacter latus]NWH05277.1 chemotaxis protein CheV [Desulfobacter latus]